jgi:hypothetical protein
LATISSGLCRFLAIVPSIQNGPRTNISDGSLQRAQTTPNRSSTVERHNAQI